MKTQLSTTSVTEEIRETVSGRFAVTRIKNISAADVWNIQRNKSVRAQRRFL